jgi:hypothetical protein
MQRPGLLPAQTLRRPFELHLEWRQPTADRCCAADAQAQSRTSGSILASTAKCRPFSTLPLRRLNMRSRANAVDGPDRTDLDIERSRKRTLNPVEANVEITLEEINADPIFGVHVVNDENETGSA